jgi:hypothetical protein
LEKAHENSVLFSSMKLAREQAKELLAVPDRSTLKGKRD